ncbi:pyridoxal phosphate-dependent aminotransferase [Solicola gregarius]|uniref:Aminotransferase class I/II-fold pyridoxal phosphate-dependent enzyme n=1 Tax=Solicola gregarius TaxID=2908642 RepID=A0AA46YL02_9ACTN|nr:aminotransferase class I/II-fold pyridoxal phosphate-dependent enzyme [Solicola gregarius]UYM06360.1 aminotransferase class I/II-fold pyridoxal phosphate-dependent enzyme [Solicola gregarius]
MGEPTLDTPDEIVEACVASLRNGETHYVDQRGLPELRAALANQLQQRSGIAWRADQVLVTHGATSALAAVMLALIDPGDVVVIPQPAYSLYEDVVTLAGGVSRLVALSDDLHWDLKALEEAFVGARMMVFANPSNPTGMVHTAHELRTLAALAERSGVMVVADEAYDRIVFDGTKFTSVLGVTDLAEHALYVQTFSKTYAMTGWRLGYVAGPAELLKPVARVHATMNGSCNAFVQRAAMVACEMESSSLTAMAAEYERKRDVLIRQLAACRTLTVRRPEGAFYALVGYRHSYDSVWVSEQLLSRGVVVRAGSEYGPDGEGFIRLSFATSMERLETAVPIITDFFDRLPLQP